MGWEGKCIGRWGEYYSDNSTNKCITTMTIFFTVEVWVYGGVGNRVFCKGPHTFILWFQVLNWTTYDVLHNEASWASCRIRRPCTASPPLSVSIPQRQFLYDLYDRALSADALTTPSDCSNRRLTTRQTFIFSLNSLRHFNKINSIIFQVYSLSGPTFTDVFSKFSFTWNHESPDSWLDVD